MSININNSPSFTPANRGNGTFLEAAVKAKDLAEEEGKMALQLIESAASPSSLSNPVDNAGHHVNIRV
jgi:hypothetical protein